MLSRLVLFLALPLVFLTGCAGYHLGGSKPSSLTEVTRLYVPTFKNQTLEPRLGVLVTNAVIKQLQVDGTYVISNKEDADAVLEGRIEGINRSQFRADRVNVLRTSQLLLTMDTSYVISRTGSGIPLHTGTASANSYVILEANLQLSETQALEDAAQRLAGRLVSDIAEGW
jgi:outer membrane lipopolysaccharide assembly protein LptE/RlpB